LRLRRFFNVTATWDIGSKEIDVKSKLIALIGVFVTVLLVSGMVACGGGDDDTPSDGIVPDTDEGITTDSGLRYIEIVAGDGLAVQPGDIVKVHYTGTLEDGTQFDTSLDTGEPLEFASGMGKMIAGFDEGVAMMKEGGKAKLIIPPDIGYGAQDKESIPPNSTLIFELELLSIERPDPPVDVAENDYNVSDSGLKYYDFEVGDGDQPEAGQTAIIDFTMWREDGARVESTLEIGQPFPFPIGVGQMLEGLDEGVLTMNVGGKRQLVVPSELAFGEQGTDVVPPNTALIFEVELIVVIPVPEAADQTIVDEGDYTTIESGLKYFDIVTGEGDSPEVGQLVVVHFTGWLTDGTKFDSTIDGGLPTTFSYGMGRMISGLDEGVGSMKVGGKRQLVVPPELGLGDQDIEIVPPNSTLIFEVELMDIL